MVDCSMWKQVAEYLGHASEVGGQLVTQGWMHNISKRGGGGGLGKVGPKVEGNFGK